MIISADTECIEHGSQGLQILSAAETTPGRLNLLCSSDLLCCFSPQIPARASHLGCLKGDKVVNYTKVTCDELEGKDGDT